MTSRLDGFHDAEMIALEVDRHARSVTLRFVLPDKGVRIVELGSVSHFRANDVIGQNVVSRMLVSSNGDFSPGDLLRWIRWVTSLDGTGPFATDEQIEAIRRQVEEGQLLLVVLEPSWGAELAVLAEAYSVS